jgi:Flp pilus assembly protein TadG
VTRGSVRARRFDWRDDRGQFAGIEAIPFGVLVFVIGSLLVANAWAVVDAKLAVSSAAREAARTYVEAPPDADAAASAAHAAAADALRGHGRDPAKATIAINNPADAMVRCVRVTASVTYRLPAVTLPVIGGYGRGFSVTSHHSEIIDPWRDDLPGQGCG